MPEPVLEDVLEKNSDQQQKDDVGAQDKNEEGTINYDDEKFEQDDEEEAPVAQLQGMRSTENLKKSEMPISTVPNSDEPIPAVIATTV